jgi:alanine racemase
MRLTRRNFLALSSLSTISFLPGLEKKRVTNKLHYEKRESLSHFDGWIELNAENMYWNLEKLRKRVKVPIMAVIKANGYGHGLVEVARFLESNNIDHLMVGKLQEAYQLRESEISSPILNFGPFSREEADTIVQCHISQSVFTEDVEDLNSSALKLQKKAKVHIHVDTGLGRAGIQYYKVLPYIEKICSLKAVAVEGISTTLTEDPDFDRIQIKRFLSLCQEVEIKGISLGRKHAASSSGIMTLPSSYLDMVRPGITLFGYYPSEETQKKDSLSLRPVLQLKSRIYTVKTLRPGDSVSYHRAYTAKKKEKIALIPVGYSDGYPSHVVNKASVLIRGKRFPLIGAITANHMEALLSDDEQVSTGDEVVIIGTQGNQKVTADELARWAGVSTYKILLGLNPLLPRMT